MAKKFVPGTPLETAIYQGSRKRVITLLAALSIAERQRLRPIVIRMAKRMYEARHAYGDRTRAGWGRDPTDAQYRALADAAFLCGTASDAAENYFDIDDLIELAREHPPPWLETLGDALLNAPAWQANIRGVQALIAAGLVKRPDSERYILGLMLLLANRWTKESTAEKVLEADPGLKQVLLRILEVEGTQEVSLAALDKYERNKKSLAEQLVKLSEDGVYPRAVLIDKALAALERGWNQFRSGWFSAFHVLLAPSFREMKPHARRYLALLGSRTPPTVTFALDCVAALNEANALEHGELLEALRPVFTSAVKSQVEAGLAILDGLVKGSAAHASQAAQVMLPALAHSSAPLQKEVLRRLSAWDAAGTTRTALTSYAKGIAAVNRNALAALMGGSAAGDSKKKTSAPAARGPAAARMPANPLDETRAVAPIQTLDELVDRVAYALENDTDITEFERALAGLIRFAPFDESARARFAPVAKRVPKIRKPVSQQLGRLLLFLVSGAREQVAPSQNFSGHRNELQEYLARRIDDLMDSIACAAGQVPLATPTHQRGFIDPLELVSRLSARSRQGVPVSRADFLTALMRIAPRNAGAAQAAARQLGENPYVQALRYALGDESKPRDAQLHAAADRVRRLMAGQEPAPRAWSIESKKSRYGKPYTLVVIDRSVPGSARDPVAMLEREAQLPKLDCWFEVYAVGCADEGSINCYATLLPSELDSFCAEGADLICRNIDWWQAQWQNKAYLRALLDSTAPMGPMARLMLAAALAGKEAGQTAVAVDVLVQSCADQRLDAKLLGRDVAVLVRGGHVACARYAKSLAAALRIDGAIAPALIEVSCAALTARPADPPRDSAALVDLLLEILVAGDLPLPGEARAVLEGMKLGGRGEAARKQVLARA